MNNCLRQFILSINQLQIVTIKDPAKKKVDRYLKKLEKKWKTGNNERRQYEATFLKIVSGEFNLDSVD